MMNRPPFSIPSPYTPHLQPETKQPKQKKRRPGTPQLSEYQKTLTLEIEKARVLIESSKVTPSPISPHKQSLPIDTLRTIQQNIRRKNAIIKQLEQQIINMKSRYKDINQPLENKIHNLVIQIRTNCTWINDLTDKLRQKKLNYSKKQQKIHVIFQKYANKCKEQNTDIIDFQKFKNMERLKKKQEQWKIEKSQENTKKKLSSIVQTNSTSKKLQQQQQKKQIPTEPRTITQSLSRRNVAEAALKNERKKHRKQVANLMSKMQFLKDEDNDLEIKIQSKLIQLENAEKKFTEHYTCKSQTNKSNNNNNNHNNNNHHNNLRNSNSNRKMDKLNTVH